MKLINKSGAVGLGYLDATVGPASPSPFIAQLMKLGHNSLSCAMFSAIAVRQQLVSLIREI